jgi:hypothetical protein
MTHDDNLTNQLRTRAKERFEIISHAALLPILEKENQ